MNLREACHMIELWTTPQGHPDHRNACQKMYSLIKQINPVISEGIKFVDMNSYDLERFKSEKNMLVIALPCVHHILIKSLEPCPCWYGGGADHQQDHDHRDACGAFRHVPYRRKRGRG